MRGLRVHVQPSRLHVLRTRRLLRIPEGAQHPAREGQRTPRDQIAPRRGRALHVVLPVPQVHLNLGFAARRLAGLGHERDRHHHGHPFIVRTRCVACRGPARRSTAIRCQCSGHGAEASVTQDLLPGAGPVAFLQKSARPGVTGARSDPVAPLRTMAADGMRRRDSGYPRAACRRESGR